MARVGVLSRPVFWCYLPGLLPPCFSSGEHSSGSTGPIILERSRLLLLQKCRGTPCGQYISNKGMGHLLVRDGKANFHKHKIFKLFMRLEGFGWGEVALLGFVFVVDLFDLAPLDAQMPLG